MRSAEPAKTKSKGGAMDGKFEIEAVMELPALRIERIWQRKSGPFQRAYEFDHPSLTYIPSQYREPARGCFGSPLSHRSFLKFGPASFVPPHLPIHVQSPGFTNRPMMVLHFAQDALDGVARNFERRDQALLSRCFDIRERRIVETMDRMRQELDEDTPGRDQIMSGLAMVLQGELTRYFAEDGHATLHTRGALVDWQMQRISNRISDDSLPPPDIDELARICGVGRRHFMRAFKARTGFTAMEWVDSATCERAVHLLQDASRPIKEISALLGYSHPGSFSTAFTRQFGMSPREWRSRNAMKH